jgi:L-amino acid N-acyltransferase YncA
MKVVIRTAEARDLPAIVEIYNQAVRLKSATAELSPVSLQSRAKWLAEHDPASHPVFVAQSGKVVVGWCSISEYRPGRGALRHTAEISYYVHEDYRRMSVASKLVEHAIRECPRLGIKTLIAILLDINVPSLGLLEKFGFQKWGHMPDVADFDGRECSHLYYGLRLGAAKGDR